VRSRTGTRVMVLGAVVDAWEGSRSASLRAAE
jgi:hypothetical protein